MSQAFVESELNRCRTLLSRKRTRVALEETPPEQDPASLGAFGGLGFVARQPDVQASVYVFEDWGQHAAVIQQLKNKFPAHGVSLQYGTNGGLLFFGHTRTDGPEGVEAEFRLADLVTAFSGNE
jgi:hypothetical protein